MAALIVSISVAGFRDSRGRYAKATEELRRGLDEALLEGSKFFVEKLKKHCPVHTRWELAYCRPEAKARYPERLKKSIHRTSPRRVEPPFEGSQLDIKAHESLKFTVGDVRPHLIFGTPLLRFVWENPPFARLPRDLPWKERKKHPKVARNAVWVNNAAIVILPFVSHPGYKVPEKTWVEKAVEEARESFLKIIGKVGRASRTRIIKGWVEPETWQPFRR